MKYFSMLIFAMLAVSSAADITNIQGNMTSIGVMSTGSLESNKMGHWHIGSNEPGLMRKTPRAHVVGSLTAADQSHSRLDHNSSGHLPENGDEGTMLDCSTWTSPANQPILTTGERCYPGFNNVRPDVHPPSYFPVEARFHGAWVGASESPEASVGEYGHGASPNSQRSVWMARIVTTQYYKMVMFELWWTQGPNAHPCMKQTQAKYKEKGSQELMNDQDWEAAWESGTPTPSGDKYQISSVDLVSCKRSEYD